METEKGIKGGDAVAHADQKENAEKEKGPYAEYKKLGGIINIKDYESAIKRTKETITVSRVRMGQAESIAKFAGIELHNSKDTVDLRVKLWAVLRGDSKPKDVEYHHATMGDIRLFAEALRMLGDNYSLDKLRSTYPNIPFD